MELSAADEAYVADTDALVVLRGGGLPEYHKMLDDAYRRGCQGHMIPESIAMTPGSHLSVKGWFRSIRGMVSTESPKSHSLYICHPGSGLGAMRGLGVWGVGLGVGEVGSERHGCIAAYKWFTIFWGYPSHSMHRIMMGTRGVLVRYRNKS